MDLGVVVSLGAALAASVMVVLVLCVFLVNASALPVIERSRKEKHFYDAVTGEFLKFPSIGEAPTVSLSVVVPAYDEEKRLPPMLNEAVEFLQKRSETTKSFSYEIIVVSDGSRDNTVAVAQDFSTRLGSDKIRVLSLEKNRGKGGAVRLGTLSSRGAIILFADADGATTFSELAKLEAALEHLVKGDYVKNLKSVAAAQALVVGSRSHLEEESLASRSTFRTLLMRGFHLIVWSFAVRTVRDTQCGFKLFTRATADVLFSSVHVERWAFDVELLYLAELFQIPLAEIPVEWTEIDGSKIVPVLSWLQMGRDVFLIWVKYLIRAWKIAKRPGKA